MTRSDRCAKTLSRVCERLAWLHRQQGQRDDFKPVLVNGEQRLILKQAIEELEAITQDLEKGETHADHEQAAQE